MSSFLRGLNAIRSTSPQDIVILSSVRTPICRAYKGQLREAYAEELLATVLSNTKNRFPSNVQFDDVSVGVVLSELGGSKAARAALHHVGFDSKRTCLYTVNRACASSLQALASVASSLRLGEIDVAIAAGMESMTRNYGSRAIPTDPWPTILTSDVQDARDCLMSMGLTAENVARRHGISRWIQDRFAVESHKRAAEARARGQFKSEIVPFILPDGSQVTEDDGIRQDTTEEKLSRLSPAFLPENGTCTAGNASQISDGAAAIVLTRREKAISLKVQHRIIGRFISATVTGCQPDEMGVGPAVAVPRLLQRHGIRAQDVERWEINEAFAAQTLYCLRSLGLESAWERGRVNPHGGAIALGHPLGASGARLTATLLHAMSPHDLGVVTMCVGTGMGMAALFVRE